MIHRHEFRAMGCRMLGLVDSDEFPLALQNMPARLEEWEQVLSRFRPDSELCLLNRMAGRDVGVSNVLWDVFVASREAEKQTFGLVNPLIMGALIQAGYDRSFDQVQNERFESELLLLQSPVPPLSEIVADASAHRLCLPEGAQLDFGGVAKGWAASHAVRALSEYGPALFSAGGDLAVSGPQSNGEPWEISVDDPFRPGQFIEVLYLEHGGVATSGKDYRRWVRGGLPQHHIIDPRTGVPAETDVLTATVIAPTAELAEAFAKAILISGSEDGLAWLDGDANLAGLLILENGQMLYSRNMDDYL